MNFWHSAAGMVRVKLMCADPVGALAAVNRAGIDVYQLTREDDEITAFFSVRRSDLRKLQKLCDKKWYELHYAGKSGVYWTAQNLLRRPVLVLGLLLFLTAVFYIPSRVFFVRIEGNVNIPDRLILETCAQCGIGFGASRKDVRSERMKNALLEAIPELQWAGINTSGCVATVTVRERSDEESGKETGGVCSIVAACDGVITECTVVSGNRVCRVGQAVRAGDLLVSGYTDCGICIRATRAEAEVYALTQRNLTAVTPTQWQQEGENTASEKKYALIIGKKRINFYKGSGISGTTCDKIYSENYVTLPGGFILPVAIVTEVWTASTQETVELDREGVLPAFAESYLKTQMIAGSVLQGDETVTQEEGLLCLQGNYACSEMIAQVRNEEIIKPYGNDN